MTGHIDMAAQWFREVWNEKQEGAIDRMMSPEVQMHGIGPEPLGIDHFKALHSHLCEEIPDLRIDLDRIVEDGDWVVVRAVARGRHGPSGATIEFFGGGFVRYENGLVIETHESWDLLGYLVQTGVVDGAVAGKALGMV